jgi:(p)ppGpp synthase/HD superfamily hydrolase
MGLSSRFTDALSCAVDLHRDQLRKVSGTPYVAHLLRVAGTVLEYGGSEDEAIAALLHDAVEDQGGDPVAQEILRRFGPTVAGIVLGCTDTDETPKPPWRKRKEDYLARLRDASPSVCLVKAADKLDNARSLLMEYRRRGESLWSYFHGGRDGTLWYYRQTVEILKAAGGNPIVEELERAVAEIERQVLQSATDDCGLRKAH